MSGDEHGREGGDPRTEWDWCTGSRGSNSQGRTLRSAKGVRVPYGEGKPVDGTHDTVGGPTGSVGSDESQYRLGPVAPPVYVGERSGSSRESGSVPWVNVSVGVAGTLL